MKMPFTNTIHILSVIPRLGSMLSKELPNATVVNVITENLSEKYGRVLSNTEFSNVKNAEIILADANLIAQVYDKLPNAKFIQCTWAGVEKLIDHVRNGSTPTCPITRLGSQSFSQLMAEYVVGQILLHERAWLDVRQNQLQSTWSKSQKIISYRSLSELTVAVLGVGIIGREVIQALKNFRCQVLGFGRSQSAPQGLPLDKYFTDLPSLLEKCDYLVNILPSTPDTKRLLENDVLSFAKKEPVFINVGRGDIISEDNIIKALNRSWISSAILDVFETEPLPSSSPLWVHPKVMITPHASAVSRPVDVIDTFLNNLQRFLNNEPLDNVINFERGY